MPNFSGSKWVTSGQTFPTVTWSFATLNLSYSGVLGGYHLFDSAISAQYQGMIRQAFSTWEAVSMIDLVEVVDAQDVDIRVGNAYIDGPAKPGQGSVLGIAQSWTSGGSLIASQVWFDSDAYQTTTVFFQVALHEIGHTLGLSHADHPEDTMYYLSSPQNETGKLSADDIAGIQTLYGVRSNATFPSAPGKAEAAFASAASSLFFLKALPTAPEQANRSGFAETQYNYYATVLKVTTPAIGPYEAFGQAFSSEAAFAPYKSGTTTAFVAKAYLDVFHRAPTSAQQSHFEDQVGYFRSLYLGAGIDAASAEGKARGAAAGQMLGFAMTDATERAQSGQTLDDSVNSYLATFTAASVQIAGVAADDYAGVLL